jgi:hypothetical protein
MTDENHDSQHHELSAADAQAIDALIDAGLDVSRVRENLKPRALKAAGLLSLLQGDCKTESALVDVTMARVQRAGAPGRAEAVEAVLSAEDGEALDAYVAAEFRSYKVAASLRPRAERIDALVHLISKTPTSASSAASLVDSTMRRVTTSAETSLEPIPISRGSRFRLADLVSVAAVLMIGAAVLWPILSTVRTYNQKNQCAANLGTIASAMGTYTGDSKDTFPMATASYGGSWLDVGTTPDRSNSSNLFTLAKAGYTALRNLACAGNSKAVTQAAPGASDWESLPEVSYSYYIMFGPNRPSPITSPHTIILADKSPVAIQLASRTVPMPESNSPNHGGRGQWALRADGTAVWLSSPKDNGDNIWLTRKQQVAWESAEVQTALANARRAYPRAAGFLVEFPLMKGDELPESANDSILGP